MGGLVFVPPIAKINSLPAVLDAGHELNFAEDEMAAFEVAGGSSEEHCLKMLKNWIEEEGDKATFSFLVSALMGVPGLKSIVAGLKEGKDARELLADRAGKRSVETEEDGPSGAKRKKTRIESV